MCAYPFHHMDEEPKRSGALFSLIVVCVLIAGGVYFAKNFQVAGLDKLSITSKDVESTSDTESIDDLLFVSASGDLPADQNFATPAPFASRPSGEGTKSRNLRIASWALSGLGPSKLASEQCRVNLIRMIRKFDVIALQQITAFERDLIPRLVDEINQGGRIFDYAIGKPTGPKERPEQLAVLFKLDRVRIDHSQTYTVDDPHNRMTYDPLVVWFRAAEASADSAWTFSLVNVRINLARAPVEVSLLPSVFNAVREDGRGEDDVVMAGLFQADDSYLIPRVMGTDVVAAVRSSTTDIFHRHQTCNILVHHNRTSEFVGRGGPVDFLRLFNLELGEAESVSSHLPVFAEFVPTEGGAL